MKAFPENLSADKTPAQLLAYWDCSTGLINNEWKGTISNQALRLYDNTPVEAKATSQYPVGGVDVGGAIRRPNITGFWMATSFYKVYESVTFVLQLGNYTMPTPLIGGSFIAVDTVAAQPIKAGDSAYYDYLGMTYLSSGPNYSMPPGGPKYLPILKHWQTMDKNDWVAIGICFSPPEPGIDRGPYIFIGDSANYMVECNLLPNPAHPEAGWVQKIEDIKSGYLSVDAVKMLLSYGPNDVYVKKMGIYGGMINGQGLVELKSAMGLT